MTYNKEQILRFKELHPVEYREMTLRATNKYRAKNADLVRLKDKYHKRFTTEWRSFRNIDLF